MITGSIHQEDKTIINVHQSPEYLKQILTSLEGEIDYSTTIVGDLIITFNNGQMIQTKISKKILGLSFTLGQIYFIDIYRKFYPRAAEYTFFFSSVQFISVAQSCLTLCDPMNRSTPGLPVHHQLPEFTQTHVHRVGDAIQPSHPLSSPSPPAPNPSQHQSLFQ